MKTIASIFQKIASEQPRLSKDEEQVLAERAQAGDIEARDRLILSAIPAALHYVSKRAAFNREELLMSAIEGVVEAVASFRPGRNARFSSYAYKRIGHKVTEHIGLLKSQVVSRGYRAHFCEYLAAVEKLRMDGVNDPSEDQIEKLLPPSVFVKGFIQDLSSIDDDGVDTLGKSDSRHEMDLSEARELLEQLIQRLPESLASVVRMRHGFDGEEMVFEEIGTRLGYSKQNACNLYKKAVEKLKWHISSLNALEVESLRELA